MRRFVLSFTLFLAACAARPQQPEPVTPPLASVPRPQVRSSILGLSAQDLVAHFGHPALQVREGTSLKLQFRSPRCVLDAYLYPSNNGGGVQRVTYVDTRLPSGAAADQAACISALENPS